MEKVIVELDRWPFHNDRISFGRDRDQDATMLLHRIITIRVTEDRLEDTLDQEAERLHAILRARREEARN